MSKLKKLTGDTLILAIGTFSSKLLVFFLMPLYTAWLTTEQFGTAELLTSTANLLIPLAGIGLGNAIFRFAADRAEDKREVLSSGIVLLGAGLGAFLLLSPVLSLIGYFDGYVWLIVLYVLFANLQSVVSQYVRALDRTKLFAFQGIFNTLVTVGMNLLFLWKWQMGVTGYVLSVVVGNLLTVLFLTVAVRLWRDVRLSLVNRKTVWSMLRFGLPLVPTTVCWLITDLSDRFMVTYFCGEGTTGIYAAAYKIPTIVTLLSGIFLQAWQFSAVITSSDEEESRRFYGQVFSAFLSVVMLGGGVLILASRWLTGLLLAESYFDARLYMPTLIAAAVLEALVSFLATVYMVKKRSVHSFVTAMGGGLLNVLLNLLLIPSHGVLGGALGAAMATLAAYALVLILRLTDVPRLLPFAIPRGRLALSCALLFGEVVLMSMDASFGFLGTLALFVLLCVLHARPTYRGIRHLLSFRRGKGKI